MPVALVCEQCGRTVMVPPSRVKAGARFCSRACTTAYRRENGFPRTVERVPLECVGCGETFHVIPSLAFGERARRACSWECEAKYREGRPTEEHPRYVPKVQRECEWCGEEFTIPAAWARKESGGRFCSGSCRAAWVCRHAQNRISQAEQDFAAFLRDHGFDFEVQVQVKSYVVDVLFPAERVAVEFDGDYWHDLPRTAEKDRRKNAALRRAGYEVIRIRQSEHEADPEGSIARIAAAVGTEN